MAHSPINRAFKVPVSVCAFTQELPNNNTNTINNVPLTFLQTATERSHYRDLGGFGVAGFKIRVPHCRICHTTPTASPRKHATLARCVIRTPLLHLSRPFKSLLSTLSSSQIHSGGGLCKRGKAPTKSQYEVRKSGFLFSVRPVSAQIPPEGEKKRFCCSTRITELSFGSNVKHCCRVSEKIGADFRCVKAQSAPRALLSADRATQQQRFNPPPVCQVRLD